MPPVGLGEASHTDSRAEQEGLTHAPRGEGLAPASAPRVATCSLPASLPAPSRARPRRVARLARRRGQTESRAGERQRGGVSANRPGRVERRRARACLQSSAEERSAAIWPPCIARAERRRRAGRGARIEASTAGAAGRGGRGRAAVASPPSPDPKWSTAFPKRPPRRQPRNRASSPRPPPPPTAAAPRLPASAAPPLRAQAAATRRATRARRPPALPAGPLLRLPG